MVSSRAHFKRNQLVRMTQGVYKNDLAQILDVYEGGSRLLIRYMPRINMAALMLPKDKRRGFGGGPRNVRPPPRLFDRDEIIEATGGEAVIESRMKYGSVRVDVWGTGTYKVRTINGAICAVTA